jgi:mono/diheme cytochrome c family protein
MRAHVPVAIALMFASPWAAVSGQVTRSVWDGVYTEEQAGRGKALYAAHCTNCHGDTLGGGETAPALTGVAFNATWEGVPLADLFERMRLTMPPGRTGSVSSEQHADILAHLLKMSAFPTGQAPLIAEKSSLTQIRFTSVKPQP